MRANTGQLPGVAALAFLLYWLAMPETLKVGSQRRQSDEAASEEPRSADAAASAV
jgi:hypothetical protein